MPGDLPQLGQFPRNSPPCTDKPMLGKTVPELSLCSFPAKRFQLISGDMSPSRGAGFKIIGADNVVYGPVELPTLVDWLEEERVTPETWVFSERDDAWR